MFIYVAKGTFGPMASAFSVCALVENWRVVVPPGGNEAHGIDVKDPRWYVQNPVSKIGGMGAVSRSRLNNDH